jgi:hypothetical protein
MYYYTLMIGNVCFCILAPSPLSEEHLDSGTKRPTGTCTYADFLFTLQPNNLPTIKGSANFQGIALLDSDVYIPNDNGFEWYQNQNNFFRQVRNFVLDLTEMTPNAGFPADNAPTGIHWQVAQATSLQNIHFNMRQGGQGVGIFSKPTCLLLMFPGRGMLAFD